MNRMLARLEDARNSQRRFVSDASHELRSPITTIRQHAEVALAHPDRANAQELAEVVLAEQQRMQRLVEDLLLLARADEHIPTPRAPVDLDDLALEEARRLRSTTSVEVDTTAVGAARVHGDVDALRRVLRNLGENAARHASSRIDIGVAERGRRRDVDRRRRRAGNSGIRAGAGAGAIRSARRGALPRRGWQRSGTGHRRRGGPRTRRLSIDLRGRRSVARESK